MRAIRYITVFTLFILCVGCADHPDTNDAFTGMSAKKIFTSGEKAMSQGNYTDAINYFEGLEANYPYGQYAEQGQLDIIYAYYAHDDMASVLAAADRFIHLYPRSEHVDYAYYMKGRVMFEKGFGWMQRNMHVDLAERDLHDAGDSFKVFRELVVLFPHSRYAVDAKKHMVYIRNLLAKRELEVAEFYYKRKAYVAAANRANYLLNHFQGAPQVIGALNILTKSYRALGETKKADDALKTLHYNFPKFTPVLH